MEALKDLVRTNLRRMLAADGRPYMEIAVVAWPNRSAAAGRKQIVRTINNGWLRPETAEGLMEALGVKHLAEFYLPPEPEVTELRVRRVRLRAAKDAVSAAAASLRAAKAALRTEVKDATAQMKADVADALSEALDIAE